MKKFLFAALAIMLAASCMKSGKSSASWTHTYAGSLKTELADSHEEVYSEQGVIATIDCPDMFQQRFNFEFSEGVQFVSGMPRLKICLPNLEYTMQQREEEATNEVYDWIIDQKDVVPTIGGVPYETFKMSVVKGIVTNKTVKMEFWLSFRGVEYHVVFEWDRITPPSDSGDGTED